jgi:uncharacterized tellurite resistance protein B-like protein
MEAHEYQRMVLVHALHIMACDGGIDDREVNEIRRMITDTPYFDELTMEEELGPALERLKAGGAEAIDEGFEELGRLGLPDRQRMRLLDVLLHVVHADETVNEAECTYLQRTQAALGLTVDDVAHQFPNNFSLFVPGAGRGFSVRPQFEIPIEFPDAGQFL